MTNVEFLQEEELEKLEIEVEEVNLEDLIILGEDKLINISVKYPEEHEGTIRIVKTKAKIKQLTMKELRNIDINNITMDTVVVILTKALFTQEEKAFSKELIFKLPIGVCFAISREILKISGIEEDKLGF